MNSRRRARSWTCSRALPDVVRAAADALGLDQAGEHAGGFEGGDDAGGGPVADGVAVVVELVLGEEDGELDLACAGAAVLAFPLPPGGLLRRHGDTGAVDGGVELVGQRGRRERDHLPGGDEPGALAAGGRERGAAGLGGPLDAP